MYIVCLSCLTSFCIFCLVICQDTLVSDSYKPPSFTGDESSLTSQKTTTGKMNFDTEQFKSLDTNPGGTLEAFNKYVDRIKLIFNLAFRKTEHPTRHPTKKRNPCFYFEVATI